jgi:hypothetical protein
VKSEVLYEKCAGCHLFIESNPDAGEGFAAFAHLDRGDAADELIVGTHDATPSGERFTLEYWRTHGPDAMRARFTR